MKTQTHTTPIALGIALLLANCAAIDPDGPSIATQARQFSFADLRPAKIDVIEVRESDLKPLPTGSERALAHERSGRRFGGFSPPVQLPDFESSTDPSILEGSLLPSLDF